MSRDARFWRNVTLITGAHLLLLTALVHWNAKARQPNAQNVVWLNAGGPDASGPVVGGTPSAAGEHRSESPPMSSPAEMDETPAAGLPPIKSEIELPPPTPSPVWSPTPVSTPSPTPVRTPSPKSSPTPRLAKTPPKPTPKKTIAKATPKPSPKKSETQKASPIGPAATPRKTTSQVAGSGNSGATVGAGHAAGRNPEFNWYGRMLYDRFNSEWVQPKTVIAQGSRISALVRVRIEKDGRVSNFTIVQPSGNVVLDESVAAVAKKVTRVDPLPTDLGREFYEVTINFALNPEQ